MAVAARTVAAPGIPSAAKPFPKPGPDPPMPNPPRPDETAS